MSFLLWRPCIPIDFFEEAPNWACSLFLFFFVLTLCVSFWVTMVVVIVFGAAADDTDWDSNCTLESASSFVKLISVATSFARKRFSPIRVCHASTFQVHWSPVVEIVGRVMGLKLELGRYNFIHRYNALDQLQTKQTNKVYFSSTHDYHGSLEQAVVLPKRRTNYVDKEN